MQPKPCKLPELVTVQDAHANLAEAMLKHVDTTSFKQCRATVRFGFRLVFNPKAPIIQTAAG